MSLRITAVAVALAGALTACGPDRSASPVVASSAAPSVSATAAQPSAPSAPSTSASASATPSIDPSSNPAGAALTASLLPLPAGAHEWPDQTGLQDVDGFVKLLYAPSAQQGELPIMTRRGFVVAATRAWRAQDGTQVHAYLVKFTAPTGAASWYDGMTASWRDNPDEGTVFEDSADQATGLSVTKLDKLGNAGAILMAHQGDTGIYLHYFTAATPDQAGVSALMHQQLNLLAHPAAPPAA
ncbi:hypothetical protein [Kitasatospora viridis]|nr:hypothetical protein [Kitasatospora viridis]